MEVFPNVLFSLPKPRIDAVHFLYIQVRLFGEDNSLRGNFISAIGGKLEKLRFFDFTALFDLLPIVSIAVKAHCVRRQSVA